MNTDELKAKILEALEPVRPALTAACLKQLNRQVERVKNRLEECGGDFKVAYPYGHSRETYLQREVARELTVHVPDAPGTLSIQRMGDPELRTMKPGLEARMEAEAKASANNFLESFAVKLAGKVHVVCPGYVAESVVYVGASDPFSRSRVLLDGPIGAMAWNTQCIINVSKYGKLFNQWPTRLAK